jgi:hypothetical protein
MLTYAELLLQALQGGEQAGSAGIRAALRRAGRAVGVVRDLEIAASQVGGVGPLCWQMPTLTALNPYICFYEL